ncbi:HIT family protein [Mesorhizobium sp. ES1-3]|uniref:HIT family protein n=1 Tax=Mesorhizobium sp. ES1-3 TaxID=2876628 RepID=UPI00398D5663
MVGSKTDTIDLSTLSAPALAELGPVLGGAQSALQSLLGAMRVYLGRYGHDSGWPIHFHVIPIYQWVEDLFWQDERYRILQAFGQSPPEPATDGAELTLFVWREFCEREDPPSILGPSVHEAIEMLRENITARFGNSAVGPSSPLMAGERRL